MGRPISVEPWKDAFHENVCTLVLFSLRINRCPLTGVPVGALIVNVPADCVLACVAISVVSTLTVMDVPSAIATTRLINAPVSVVNAPVEGVVAPTVPLMLIEAVPVRFVTTPDAGVPNAGVTKVGLLANTKAPVPVSSDTAVRRFADDGVAKKVATPVPRPLMPVATGKPVAFVKVTAEGVPKAGVTKVGLVAKTRDPVPVSLVIAAAKLALVGVPKNVATPVPRLVIPVPPLATGNTPVTPVVSGRPVKLVATPDEGVPNAGVTNVGELDNTTEPEPVDVVTPVPPCVTDNAVVRPLRDVISLLAPLTAAPKLVRAFAAVEAPVPPSATAKSVIPATVPPVMATALAS